MHVRSNSQKIALSPAQVFLPTTLLPMIATFGTAHLDENRLYQDDFHGFSYNQFKMYSSKECMACQFASNLNNTFNVTRVKIVKHLSQEHLLFSLFNCLLIFEIEGKSLIFWIN